MRIDGMIVEYVKLSKYLHNSLVARIKIMGNLDIAEKRVPQDGNFRVKLEGFDISIRVSVIPTIYGEKIVMRYLTSDTTIDKAGHFGMEPEPYEKLLENACNAKWHHLYHWPDRFRQNHHALHGAGAPGKAAGEHLHH